MLLAAFPKCEPAPAFFKLLLAEVLLRCKYSAGAWRKVVPGLRFLQPLVIAFNFVHREDWDIRHVLVLGLLGCLHRNME